MKENEHNKTRLNQLEELMANTLRTVDHLGAEMLVLKDYAFENTKKVNEIMHKLDDHAENFDKMNLQIDKANENIKSMYSNIHSMNSNIHEIITEMAEDRKLREQDQKLRDAQFAFLLKRTEGSN
jgi:chromosome segregation ATPase